MEFYFPIPKEEERAIWEKVAEVRKAYSNPAVADDERVEDAGLHDVEGLVEAVA